MRKVQYVYRPDAMEGRRFGIDVQTQVTVAALMNFGLLVMAADQTTWIAEARMRRYLPRAEPGRLESSRRNFRPTMLHKASHCVDLNQNFTV